MILISGAAGTVGARLVAGLRNQGFSVRGLVLPGDPGRTRLEDLGCQVVEGDITRPASLQGAFEGVHTVYHMAAVILSTDPAVFDRVNVRGTRHMLEGAAAAGVEHFIHVSSASVVYPETTPYSRSKRECERLVRATKGLHTTIVRPTLVYEQDGGAEFLLFFAYLKKFPIVPFIGDGRALKSPVFAEDLIGGLLGLAGNKAAYDKLYNLSGPQAIPIAEFARLMLASEGKSKPFIHIPVFICRLMARAMGLVMKHPPLTQAAIAGITQDAALDPSSARVDLGYDPVGVRKGLARCFSQSEQTRTRRSTPCAS